MDELNTDETAPSVPVKKELVPLQAALIVEVTY